MLQPDLQRIAHIRDYRVKIEKTIACYGKSFEIFDYDSDYQRSVSFVFFSDQRVEGQPVFGISSGNGQSNAVGPNQGNA